MQCVILHTLNPPIFLFQFEDTRVRHKKLLGSLGLFSDQVANLKHRNQNPSHRKLQGLFNSLTLLYLQKQDRLPSLNKMLWKTYISTDLKSVGLVYFHNPKSTSRKIYNSILLTGSLLLFKDWGEEFWSTCLSIGPTALIDMFIFFKKNSQFKKSIFRTY